MMNIQAGPHKPDACATRVLLVEDNPGDARLLKEMLDEAGSADFQLAWCDRLSAGLEHLAQRQTDVILLDLSLPDSQGLATLTRMRAYANHLPIVVLTAFDDAPTALSAVREGAQDYLIKGQVDANLLTRAVRYAIERKRAEDALLCAAQQWRDTFDAIGDGLCLLDVHGKVLRCNKAMTVLLKRPFAEILGRPCWELLHHSSTPPEGCPFLRTQETRRRESVPLPVANRWFDDVVDPLFDRDSNLIGAVHVLTDITERRHIEAEKRRLQEQLAHAQKMHAVGTLAGGIAHEFNNINGEIIAFVDLTLELDDLHPIARRYLESVRSSAVAGSNLTQSLLAFSRKGVGQKRPVNLDSVVENVLRVVEKQLADEGVEFVVRPPEEPVIVLGDAPMLESALMNLVINARHAMLRSEVKRMTVETGLDGEKPFIRLTDTGCGIPPEYLDRVFEPFFTTKGALATGEVFDGKVHGTGLGLSVCHTIAAAHGGEVIAQSELAKGSTFTIYLSPSLRQKPATPVSDRK